MIQQPLQRAILERDMRIAELEAQVEDLKTVLRKAMDNCYHGACKPAWWDQADALLHMYGSQAAAGKEPK